MMFCQMPSCPNILLTHLNRVQEKAFLKQMALKLYGNIPLYEIIQSFYLDLDLEKFGKEFQPHFFLILNFKFPNIGLGV